MKPTLILAHSPYKTSDLISKAIEPESFSLKGFLAIILLCPTLCLAQDHYSPPAYKDFRIGISLGGGLSKQYQKFTYINQYYSGLKTGDPWWGGIYFTKQLGKRFEAGLDTRYYRIDMYQRDFSGAFVANNRYHYLEISPMVRLLGPLKTYFQLSVARKIVLRTWIQPEIYANYFTTISPRIGARLFKNIALELGYEQPLSDYTVARTDLFNGPKGYPTNLETRLYFRAFSATIRIDQLIN